MSAVSFMLQDAGVMAVQAGQRLLEVLSSGANASRPHHRVRISIGSRDWGWREHDLRREEETKIGNDGVHSAIHQLALPRTVPTDLALSLEHKHGVHAAFTAVITSIPVPTLVS